MESPYTGEIVDTEAKELSAYENYNLEQPVAISDDGKRAVITSFPFTGEAPMTVKNCDFDGVNWCETSSFSQSGGGGYHHGDRMALSGNGKRLAIGKEVRNAMEAMSNIEIYEHKEKIGWKALGQIQIRTGYSHYMLLSADGSRIAVGSYIPGDVQIFECDLKSKRHMVRVITGDADWGVLIMEFLGTSWKKIGQTLKAEDAVTENRSLRVYNIPAMSLSANGSTIAVGYDCTRNMHFVKVFRYSSERRVWIQIGQDLCDGDIDCRFGTSLSINSNGNILAVGAPESSPDSCGKVKVFTFDGNKWKSMGKPLFDESKIKFGKSICVAPNANRIAVGFPNVLGGQVHIYEYDGKDWVQVKDLAIPTSEVISAPSVSLSPFGDRLSVRSVHYITLGYCKGHLRIYHCS